MLMYVSDKQLYSVQCQMKPRGRVFYQPREKTIVRKASHWDIGQTWND